MKYSFKRISFLFFSMILLLSGCRSNTYKHWEKDAFENYIWEKDQFVIFEPVIEDTARSYNIVLGLRHIYGIKIPEIPVKLSLESPDGMVHSVNYTIKILDEKGREVADCSGSFCDIELEVEKDYHFPIPGRYIFSFSQETEFEKLLGIMELGLIIK